MWRVNLFDIRGERERRVLLPRVLQLPSIVHWHGRYFQLSGHGEYREQRVIDAVSEEDVGGVRQDSIEDWKP